MNEDEIGSAHDEGEPAEASAKPADAAGDDAEAAESPAMPPAASPQRHLVAHKLTVTVDGAHDLYNADGTLAGKSDPFCVCKIGGLKEYRKETRFRTPSVKNCLSPQWDYMGEISGFVPGQSLVFEVWDENRLFKPVLLGSYELEGKWFLDGGFSGSLELGGTARARGTLAVKVNATPCKIPAQLDDGSVALATMIWPESGNVASPQEIWAHVLAKNARLPGDHWDCTVRGALDAARNGHWAICIYLAARCFLDSGGASGPGGSNPGAEALAARDMRCRRTIWWRVVAPVVVDVPRGAERLCVRKVDGSLAWVSTQKVETVFKQSLVAFPKGNAARLAGGSRGSAEYIKTGSTVDLSQMQWLKSGRLRTLVLSDEERLQLQRFLLEETVPLPDFLVNPKEWRDYVPGGLFHVLAYPLGGDVTKALLRPMETAWTREQHNVAEFCTQSLGETLISQCSKAGRWDIVELLLKSGVPCPDLCLEFEDVCGTNAPVRNAWKRDFFNSVGNHRRSLLERAALISSASVAPAAPAATASSSPAASSAKAAKAAAVAAAAAAAATFQRLLRVLDQQGGLPDFNCLGDRQPPMTVRMAEAFSWEGLRILLEESDRYCVSARPLVSSGAFLRAPALVQDLAASRLVRGEPVRAKPRSQTLMEYFERNLAGEITSAEDLPKGCSLGGGTIDRADTGSHILDCTLRLGVSAASLVKVQLAFVSVTKEEFVSAQEALQESSVPMLPVSLCERVASLLPDGPASGGFWLPVWCPTAFIRQGGDGDTAILEIPGHCASTPYVTRPVPVRVTTATPCCRKTISGVDVFVSGKKKGVTDEHGEVLLMLPPGQHLVTAPLLSDMQAMVTVEAGRQEEATCHLGVGGDLFIYLVDASMDDEDQEEMQDFIFMCTGKEAISEEAKPFVGACSLPGTCRPPSRPAPGVIGAALQLPYGTPCSSLLSEAGSMQVQSCDGRKATFNEDLQEWLQQDECLMLMLFQNPQRWGMLKGTPALQPGPPVAAVSPSAGAAAASPAGASSSGTSSSAPSPAAPAAAAASAPQATTQTHAFTGSPTEATAAAAPALRQSYRSASASGVSSRRHPSPCGRSTPTRSHGPVRCAWRPPGSPGSGHRFMQKASTTKAGCFPSRRGDMSGWEAEMRRQQQLTRSSSTLSEQCRPTSARRRQNTRDDAVLARIPC